ncbi:MAG: DNA translocase FtsK 4TM domain-containing protein [Chitinophagaceae bacterium]|nr:DNA translocase FtsK 4TM domain-containing protein [Chitinophagaceae bacterium]
MANKLKKKVKSTPAKKPANSDVKPFRPEKDEKLDLKAIARDERTWKIIGTVSLLLAIFLFISFCSYLFTWKEDQAIASQGFSALLDNDKPVANLLGRFGAVMSYFFIFKAFGLASFLICTFFFVVGVNLLFRRKVFSIWRNLKYVTLGLLVLSVSLAFIFSNSDFAFGGGVGNMISGKLVGAMGTLEPQQFYYYWQLGTLSGNLTQLLSFLKNWRQKLTVMKRAI